MSRKTLPVNNPLKLGSVFLLSFGSRLPIFKKLVRFRNGQSRKNYSIHWHLYQTLCVTLKKWASKSGYDFKKHFNIWTCSGGFMPLQKWGTEVVTQRWKAGLRSPMVSPTDVKSCSSLLKTVRTTSTRKAIGDWREGLFLYYNSPLILDFRRASRAVTDLLKKGKPLFAGAGVKKNMGRSCTCNN